MSQLHSNLPSAIHPARRFWASSDVGFLSSVPRARWWVRLSLASILAFGCERTENSVLESVGATPTLSEVSISPTTINTDSITVGSTRKPDDILQLRVAIFARASHPLGSQNISAVRFAIGREGGPSTLSVGELFDNGSEPDQLKGDGIFSGRASFQIQRVENGTYLAEVSAEDLKGFVSNAVILPLQIIRTNQPAVLSDLQAPDTVKLASQDQLLVLQVKAFDPNGLEDIQRVVFNSFRPDGRGSSSNPFQMFDDGDPNHGDATGGDGVYSLRIVLPANTPTGAYRFEFQAFDKANEGSNMIIHLMTVTQ